MIHILQSTKNSRLISFQKSYPINKNGIGRILSLTTSNVMVKPSNQYSVMANAMSLRTVVVSLAMPLSNTSCGTMARNNHSSYAKYVNLDLSLAQKVDSLKLMS